MAKSIEQIKQEATNRRKQLRDKETRALVKFANRVLKSATANGKQLPEEEICRLLASASKNRFAQVSPGVVYGG